MTTRIACRSELLILFRTPKWQAVATINSVNRKLFGAILAPTHIAIRVPVFCKYGRSQRCCMHQRRERYGLSSIVKAWGLSHFSFLDFSAALVARQFVDVSRIRIEVR